MNVNDAADSGLVVCLANCGIGAGVPVALAWLLGAVALAALRVAPKAWAAWRAGTFVVWLNSRNGEKGSEHGQA